MTDITVNTSNDLLQQIALEYLREKKRKRRWGIFYKTLFLVLILSFVGFIIFESSDEELRNKPHVALIDIKGVMSDDGESKADNIAESLSLAYQDKGTKAIL